MIELLKNGQHALATRARPAAKDNTHFLISNQMLRLCGKSRPVRAAIGDHPLDLAPKQSAAGVDLFQREHLGVDHRTLAHSHWTRLRVEDAYDDWIAVDEQPVVSKPTEPPQC